MQKHTDPTPFIDHYAQLASKLIAKKHSEINALNQQREGTEQAEHLKRLIEEI